MSNLPIPVQAWVQERINNCYRVAATKTGDDQAGWLQDAAYFELIQTMMKRPGPVRTDVSHYAHIGVATWDATVVLNGVPVVTVGPRHLSGREIGPDEEAAIRLAVAHLLAFIGDTDARDATLSEVISGILMMHAPNQACADFANAILTNIRNLKKL